MKQKKKQINSLISYFFNLFFVLGLLFLIATSNHQDDIMVSNINAIKAIESSRIEKIDVKQNEDDNSFVKVFSIQEIVSAKTKKIEFTGTLTGYGPDCVGCSGIVGCPPYLNVKDGNIYYEDATYKKIRILAADKSIPCGSIIKISNYKFEPGEFYGIVLDRGSAINGLTMDLLYDSEESTKVIGRAYDINFKIERWGF